MTESCCITRLAHLRLAMVFFFRSITIRIQPNTAVNYSVFGRILKNHIRYSPNYSVLKTYRYIFPEICNFTVANYHIEMTHCTGQRKIKNRTQNFYEKFFYEERVKALRILTQKLPEIFKYLSANFRESSQ